jgi:eukaryotic-like serine/threonine-protein kinase
MPSTFNPSEFAATTMDSQFGEGSQDAVSYGYLGRYRLDRMIGHGAMGAVFEAFDATLGRTIAIKTLYTQPDQADGGFDSAMVDAAILQEARAAATLNHPHIVTVYDAGRAPSSVLGRELPYVAMELLQGCDLRERMNAGPPLSQRDAVALVGKLALALDHAHKAGVLHRDIKPANVFMSKTNGPKILDFGLAKFTARAKYQANAASSELIAGSPQYMSPEMVHSIHDTSVVVDARSDVYSLGVMLYELLCGKQPFDAPTLELLQARIVNTPPEPPHKVNPAIPPELSAIMLTALAKKPEDRYRSAGQLARELRRWGAQAQDADSPEPITKPGALQPASGPVPLENAVAVPVEANFSVAKSRSPVLVALAITAGLALLAALWWTEQQRAPAKQPPAVATAKSTATAQPNNPQPAAPLSATAPVTAPTATPAGLSAVVPASAASTATAAPSTATPVSTSAASPAVTVVTLVGVASADPSTASPATASSAAAVPSTAKLRISLTPWGEVEVDGKKMGVSPPLTSLTLEPGPHTVVVRNSDFTSYTFKIKSVAGKTDSIVHKFE